MLPQLNNLKRNVQRIEPRLDTTPHEMLVPEAVRQRTASAVIGTSIAPRLESSFDAVLDNPRRPAPDGKFSTWFLWYGAAVTGLVTEFMTGISGVAVRAAIEKAQPYVVMAYTNGVRTVREVDFAKISVDKFLWSTAGVVAAADKEPFLCTSRAFSKKVSGHDVSTHEHVIADMVFVCNELVEHQLARAAVVHAERVGQDLLFSIHLDTNLTTSSRCRAILGYVLDERLAGRSPTPCRPVHGAAYSPPKPPDGAKVHVDPGVRIALIDTQVYIERKLQNEPWPIRWMRAAELLPTPKFAHAYYAPESQGGESEAYVDPGVRIEPMDTAAYTERKLQNAPWPMRLIRAAKSLLSPTPPESASPQSSQPREGVKPHGVRIAPMDTEMYIERKLQNAPWPIRWLRAADLWPSPTLPEQRYYAPKAQVAPGVRIAPMDTELYNERKRQSAPWPIRWARAIAGR